MFLKSGVRPLEFTHFLLGICIICLKQIEVHLKPEETNSYTGCYVHLKPNITCTHARGRVELVERGQTIPTLLLNMDHLEEHIQGQVSMSFLIILLMDHLEKIQRVFVVSLSFFSWTHSFSIDGSWMMRDFLFYVTTCVLKMAFFKNDISS